MGLESEASFGQADGRSAWPGHPMGASDSHSCPGRTDSCPTAILRSVAVGSFDSWSQWQALQGFALFALHRWSGVLSPGAGADSQSVLGSGNDLSPAPD